MHDALTIFNRTSPPMVDITTVVYARYWASDNSKQAIVVKSNGSIWHIHLAPESCGPLAPNFDELEETRSSEIEIPIKKGVTHEKIMHLLYGLNFAMGFGGFVKKFVEELGKESLFFLNPECSASDWFTENIEQVL